MRTCGFLREEGIAVRNFDFFWLISDQIIAQYQSFTNFLGTFPKAGALWRWFK